MGVYAKLKPIFAAMTIEAAMCCHWEPHPSLLELEFVIQHELPLDNDNDKDDDDDDEE